jgi:hypothetical protein
MVNESLSAQPLRRREHRRALGSTEGAYSGHPTTSLTIIQTHKTKLTRIAIHVKRLKQTALASLFLRCPADFKSSSSAPIPSAPDKQASATGRRSRLGKTI